MLWILFACGTPPSSLIDGRLAPCPPSPNCVITEPGADAVHAAAPLPLGDPATVRDRLVAVISSFPRTELIEVRDDYVRATFTTTLMRYVDDVEFRIDVDGGVVHVRSASRLGYGDLGVNRNRVDAITHAWATE